MSDEPAPPPMGPMMLSPGPPSGIRYDGPPLPPERARQRPMSDAPERFRYEQGTVTLGRWKIRDTWAGEYEQVSPEGVASAIPSGLAEEIEALAAERACLLAIKDAAARLNSVRMTDSSVPSVGYRNSYSDAWDALDAALSALPEGAGGSGG